MQRDAVVIRVRVREPVVTRKIHCKYPYTVLVVNTRFGAKPQYPPHVVVILLLS